MKRIRWNPILTAVAVGAVSFFGVSAPADADPPQHAQQRQDDDDRDRHETKEERRHDKAHRAGERQAAHEQKRLEHHEKKAERQQARQGKEEERRLSREQQQRLIDQQQQRVTQYRLHLAEEQRLAEQRAAELRQGNRAAQYRFHQQYLERLRQQQARLDAERNHDYAKDPYFHTPSSYRYSRDGSYRETNQYGADELKSAVNNGYGEGFRAGEADRQDRSAANYRDSYAYQDANYGYDGRYVDRDDYNHYFREGFSRGYGDGYEDRHQYGSETEGQSSVLGDVLSAILNLQSLR